MERVCERHGNVVADDRAFVPDSADCFECWPEGPLKRARVRGGGRPAGGVCSHLSPAEVRLPGSPRAWRKCLSVYGSTTGDERAGHVCGCGTPGAGVWRLGRECGAACPGHSDAVAVLVTGGIGDWIAVEGQLTPDERERIDTAYYAAPAAAEIERLWRAVGRSYPRLRHHVVLPTGSRTLYELAEVERAVGRPLPAGVRDLSIRRQFPLARPYTGSSLLSHRLADAPHPGRRYAAVVPHSTWFAPAGRAFDAADWRTLFAALEGHDLAGVVLCRDRVPIPAHPRLIDWQGELSVSQAVEVLKAADGYLGIDSWCSVLAAKLFPASRLSVKNVWPHGWENRSAYWAPRTSFGFVSRCLEVPSWS